MSFNLDPRVNLDSFLEQQAKATGNNAGNYKPVQMSAREYKRLREREAKRHEKRIRKMNNQT
jgi:hypothetical protein